MLIVGILQKIMFIPPYMNVLRDGNTTFTVANIEVLTGLNWQKPSYKAMVNITLAKKKEL